MPRIIQTHVLDVTDRQPVVVAMGQVGVGGAEQQYAIWYLRNGEGKSVVLDFVSLDQEGVTNEALLAIALDRLVGFQGGKFPNEANATAIELIKQTIGILHSRTAERMKRGVEGKAEA